MTSAKLRPPLPQAVDMGRDRLDSIRNLWDQHDIGAARDAGGDRDMAGVASHHLEDHHPVVARRGRL